MPLTTTVFGVTATVGVGLMAWRKMLQRPRRQERIVIEIQQAFRATGLGLKGAEWTIERVQRITSGKRGEGLLQGWKLILRYPEGTNLYDVQAQLPKISEWLGAQIKAQGIGSRLYLSIFDPKSGLVVPFDRKLIDVCRGSWRVAVGLSEDGWVYHDFAKTPHMLIGGSTDSGKTNYLTGLVYTLFRGHRPEELQLHVVDMKRGLSFRFLQGTPFLASFTAGTAEDHVDRLQEAADLISGLVAQMHRTYEQYEAWGVTDWREAQKRSLLVPHQFLVVDECAELKAHGKRGKEIAERIWADIASLTQLGRAAAIHVVLSTQRPEVDVVPGLVKANLDARLAFRLPDPASSVTILGRGGAEHLPPVKGRALYATDSMRLVQTPLVDLDSVRLRASLLRKLLPEKPSPVEYASEWEGNP